MSIVPDPIQINGLRISTSWTGGTIKGTWAENILPAGAFLLAVAATLTIWNPDPFLTWSYESAIFALAGLACLGGPLSVTVSGCVLAAISLWGFSQLATGVTVYRWATLNAAIANTALAGATLVGFQSLGRAAVRSRFLNALVWFGFILSLISVLAYYSSPGKILWIFPSRYPDNWGPFPSRNNFAQFLELCFPVALYRMTQENRRWTASIPPAAMLAAGLASASRAGAALLFLEAVLALWLLRGLWRRFLPFAVGAAVFLGIAGVGHLWSRLGESGPLEYRREIFRSAWSMAVRRPVYGFGLGTFSVVYPELATFDSGSSVEHAHSDWLEWAAEGGLPFTALWAALLWRLILPSIRSVWGIGILAIFLHALVDSPFARFGVSAWVCLLIGMVLRGPQCSAESIGDNS